jgi:hypothetical protein
MEVVGRSRTLASMKYAEEQLTVLANP